MLNSTLLFAVLSIGQAETIKEVYVPPAGAQRIQGDAFANWLQALPLKDEDAAIRTYSGRRVSHNGRPVDFPLVRGDLQQCADSAIRLRAEWIRASGGDLTSLSYFATSGDPLPWSRYKGGEQPFVRSDRIAWRPVDPATQSWEGWLQAVFTWAGTRSLAAYETLPVTGEPKPGHLLVSPGSPGHAVVILDVAKGLHGEGIFLLIGEGFMPAQDFHVEHGPHAGWWAWGSDGVRLNHWHMKRESLRRWK
jgi:hypothetical protein